MVYLLVISLQGGLNMRKINIGVISLTLFALIITGYLYMNRFSREGVRQVTKYPNRISINLKPKEYGQEVNNIINAIDKWYAHKDKKNIDIDLLRSTYVIKAESAESFSEFNVVLLKLFAELKNGHSNVFTGVPLFGVPILTTLIEGKVVITYLGDQKQIDKKVEVGWIIEEIDNKPAGEWMKERFSMISGSTPQALEQESLRLMFLRYKYEPKTRQYLLTSPQGDQLHLELSLSTPINQLGSYQFLPIESKNLGDYGYIAINTMTDGIVEAFDEALEEMLDKKGIILDLRKNGGGNSLNGDQMVRRFIQEETDSWHGHSIEPYDRINYSGKVIVLVGPQTFSAAESFAFDLSDSGRVITMGEPTGGDSGGGPVLFKTDGGIYFRFPTRGVDVSASGLPMEGTGLEPDIYKNQTYDDLLKGIDTLLESAIAKMEEGYF
jgi:carboxyl-terminal processing protease